MLGSWGLPKIVPAVPLVGLYRFRTGCPWWVLSRLENRILSSPHSRSVIQPLSVRGQASDSPHTPTIP